MHNQRTDDQSGDVWLEIDSLRMAGLSLDRFMVREEETWCVIGSNDSGVDQLVDLLSGNNGTAFSGRLHVPKACSVVSFKSQQELFEEEVRNDDTDFLNKIDPGTTAREFIRNSDDTDNLIRLFRLDHVLDSGYRQLSSGESRKLLILEAITRGTRYLIIQNPYDGLDVHSCAEFDRVASGLLSKGYHLLIFLNSYHDIPLWCSHIARVENGHIVAQGPKEYLLKTERKDNASAAWDRVDPLSDENVCAGEELIRLESATIGYGERTIISGLDLLVHQGEHTLITGPNGAGKSTLLAVITGDHPGCYTNELYLFGNRRGCGESIWDLKKKMGIVSPALHRSHYVPGSTLQIVISGFFDSIGLYRHYSAKQESTARKWLKNIGLERDEKTPFRRLSFARQRLVLIARALIKMPKLLILDEPTQGLDDQNREKLLTFLEEIACRQLSTIVYVSHRRDEYRSFFTQQIEIDC